MAEDVLGNIYLLKDQPEESPTKDLKEFSTLLNSCGRLHKPSLGIGTCLNDEKSREQAINLLMEYKKEIINSLNWFHRNKNTSSITETDDLVIINSEDNVKDTIIGTVTSMISKSNVYKPGTVLISLAHTLDADTKISIRISGYKIPKDVNLKETLSNITEKLGYPTGGHTFAAGSIIPQEREQEFINLALETFKTSTESFINTN
jgi:RecJ-like exonuclease